MNVVNLNEQLHTGKVALPYIIVTYYFGHFCDRRQGAVARILLKCKQITRLHKFTNVHVLVHCISVNICYSTELEHIKL
jgi:hypothetical protein